MEQKLNTEATMQQLRTLKQLVRTQKIQLDRSQQNSQRLQDKYHTLQRCNDALSTQLGKCMDAMRSSTISSDSDSDSDSDTEAPAAEVEAPAAAEAEAEAPAAEAEAEARASKALLCDSPPKSSAAENNDTTNTY